MERTDQLVIPTSTETNPSGGCFSKNSTYSTSLSSEEIIRFSRQLVLPDFGVKGQIALRGSSFLLVGAGGLGCTAGIHLAGSGAAKITIMDHDRIEASNLHRQILYSTKDIGRFKADVLLERCNNLHFGIRKQFSAVCEILTVNNALDLVRHHDIVLDCTDNVYARYLLSDACVLAGKPLVSASALKFDGQLTVYNWNGSVCRRCLFPDPKLLAAQSCDDNGVMGPVPGIMGSLQAMEAIKLAVGLEVSFAGVQLHYDAISGSFYRIKLRIRNPKCPSCGEIPVIRILDEEFLGVNTCLYRQPDVPFDQLLQADSRISVKDYQRVIAESISHVLLDVRSPAELQICGFKECLNVPMDMLCDSRSQPSIRSQIEQKISTICDCKSVIVLCRRGNDSQIAVNILRTMGLPVEVKDVEGGLYRWKQDIDPDFPVY